MSTAHAQLNTNNQSPHSTAHHCSHIQLCISDERVKIFPHHQIVFEIFDPIESLFYFSIWSDWPPLSAEKIGLSLSHIVPSIFSLICDPVEFGEVPPTPPKSCPVLMMKSLSSLSPLIVHGQSCPYQEEMSTKHTTTHQCWLYNSAISPTSKTGNIQHLAVILLKTITLKVYNLPLTVSSARSKMSERSMLKAVFVFSMV